MSEKAGVFRKESDLRPALEGIRQLREDYAKAFIFGSCGIFCQELVVMVEFESMLDIAEVIVYGALLREETRGSHYRTDCPIRNDDVWLKHTLARWTAKGPELGYQEVNVEKYKPTERTY